MEVLAEITYVRGPEIGAGQGMNSKVFEATDPQLRGPIAVKEIPKQRFGNSVERYFEEARAMFASTHPNVVRVRYACQTQDQICLAMPYYPAGSLASRIQNGPLMLRDVIRVGDGVLSGLGQVHLKRFLHLDIKPTNVLFSDTGAPLLADFGQAREITGTGAVEAPPMYVHAWPPEVIETGVATIESDLYQVGLLLYRAVNGDAWYRRQIPSDAELDSRIKRGKFPDRNLFMAHVPRRLRTIIRKALRTKPAERYRSASEMAEDLGRVRFPLDWRVTLAPEGISWRGAREGRTDLLVQLLRDGGTGWKVEAYTLGDSGTRAKGRDQHWRRCSSEGEAHDHLKSVFEALA